MVARYTTAAAAAAVYPGVVNLPFVTGYGCLAFAIVVPLSVESGANREEKTYIEGVRTLLSSLSSPSPPSPPPPPPPPPPLAPPVTLYITGLATARAVRTVAAKSRRYSPPTLIRVMSPVAAVTFFRWQRIASTSPPC